MKPALIIGGGLVALVVVAAVLVLGGGGSDEPAGSNPPAANIAPVPGDTPVAPAPVTPVQQAGVPADAEFDAWAAPIRDLGLEVTAETALLREGELVVTGFAIAGPPADERWRWTAATALLRRAATGDAGIETDSAQTLVLGELQLSVSATTAISIERSADGGVAAVAIEMDALSLASGDAPPTRVGHLSLRLGGAPLGDALLPGATVSLRATDIDLPAGQRPALGSRIALLAAELTFAHPPATLAWTDLRDAFAPQDGVILKAVELRWGLLAASGTGLVGTDAAGRLAGRLDLLIPDPLTVLDAFNAAAPFEVTAMAEVYAAILADLGPDPSAPLPFVIEIADDQAILRNAGGNPDQGLGLGTLPVLLANP